MQFAFGARGKTHIAVVTTGEGRPAATSEMASERQGQQVDLEKVKVIRWEVKKEWTWRESGKKREDRRKKREENRGIKSGEMVDKGER